MTVKLEAKEMALENTISELKIRNFELNESIKKRDLFSTVFSSLFIAISIYVFFLFLLMDIHSNFPYAPRVVELIFFTTSMIIVKKSKLSLSHFGITFKGYKKSILASLPVTFICCGLLVVFKYFLIQNNVKGLNGSLFIVTNFNYLLVLYIGIVFIQEFLARGVTQTIIADVMIGKNKNFWSILTTSCLFGLVHIELSFQFALICLGLGIYWGLLYFKHRNLAGVVISHFLIWSFAYLLGFWDYLLKT